MERDDLIGQTGKYTHYILWVVIPFVLWFRVYEPPMEGGFAGQIMYGILGSAFGLLAAFYFKNVNFVLSVLMLFIVSFLLFILHPVPAPKGFNWSIEAREQLKELIVAEEKYFEEHRKYLAVKAHPPKLNGDQPTEWNASILPSSGFNVLQWSPGSRTFCQYAIGINSTGSAYMAEVSCDFGEQSEYGGTIGYVKTSKAGDEISPAIGKCSPLGVYSEGGPVLNAIGPCDAMSQKGMLIKLGSGRLESPDHSLQ